MKIKINNILILFLLCFWIFNISTVSAHKIQINWDLWNWYYPYDELEISYNISWSYSYILDWKKYEINNFNWQTTKDSIYQDWKIDKINTSIQKNNNYANWFSWNIYKLEFLNKQNYPLTNVNFDLTNFYETGNQFDFDKTNWIYDTWFKLEASNISNLSWYYQILISSYTPTSNASLTWDIGNIVYTWHYNTNHNNTKINFKNINFKNIVSLNLQEKSFNIWEDENVKVTYSKTNWTISDSWYSLSWSTQECSDCSFIKWKTLSWNSFWTKTHTLNISWSSTPDSISYSWYYYYKLNWKKWLKTVKQNYTKTYFPIKYIEWGSLNIVWITNKDKNSIESNNNYIKTSIKPYILKNKIKKEILSSSMWIEEETPPTNPINLNTLTKKRKKYKCNSNDIINIFWEYDWNKELIFIWCEINIIWNITSKKKWDHLKIFIYKLNSQDFDYSNPKWRKWHSNIYIKENVKTIMASLYTDGSILSYLNDIQNWVFTWRNQNWFEKQLFINWKTFSTNTIWWWLKDDNNKYTIFWWKKIKQNNNDFFWKSAEKIWKTYDIQFLRKYFLRTNDTYNTWNLSSYIYNKYKCTWDKNTDTNKICYSSIVIQDIWKN